MNATQRLSGAAPVPANNLRRLVLLRSTAIGGLALVVGATQWLLGLGIPLALPLAILAVMALDNVGAWRLTRRAAPVTSATFPLRSNIAPPMQG